ncbi:hypothetical protein ASE85_04425 [Sphingobium sp. Leaf26]|uniref:hypothetical protein n=1 Tax=Sphingobium sp. Leaf26 TaxID=1735693 RepID=UPI0006F968DB|nr:hypothetical protein [Sphingobium sp. Leaf26]KQN10166.1 hypothetical protein ASE85_04425 [Sphingobium sp. Leaf26]
MPFLASFRCGLPLAAQCTLAIFGLLGLYAVPPASGRMLLLPLTEEAKAAVAPVAVATGARLVAKGPWPGSLLVEGERDALAPALLRRGVIALSAQIGGCGEPA